VAFRAPEDEIRAYYRALLKAWGNQHWWPAQSRFEVIVGAFLTQNTSWTNVERALANLRQARALSPNVIAAMPLAALEQLVRPAGYFRQKAARLKHFVDFLERRYRGSLIKMFAQPAESLRSELLALNGIGPETADSILLYAGGHSVFVVDAYTRRILARHGVVDFSATYDDIRLIVERALCDVEPIEVLPKISPLAHKPSRMSRARRSAAAQRFNEMHGLIVTTGKLHCHKQAPHCEGCPLQPFLPPGGPRRLLPYNELNP
jgi:endonuclease-3 related protein